MSDAHPTFSLQQALAVQRKLREMLGLEEERFPLPALVGMISDEIEQMRRCGHTDLEVATLITDITGIAIEPSDIASHYADKVTRGRPG